MKTVNFTKRLEAATILVSGGAFQFKCSFVCSGKVSMSGRKTSPKFVATIIRLEYNAIKHSEVRYKFVTTPWST